MAKRITIKELEKRFNRFRIIHVFQTIGFLAIIISLIFSQYKVTTIYGENQMALAQNQVKIVDEVSNILSDMSTDIDEVSSRVDIIDDKYDRIVSMDNISVINISIGYPYPDDYCYGDDKDDKVITSSLSPICL